MVEQSPATPLRSLADDWLRSVRAGGKSVRTLEAYRWSVYQLFLPFCKEQGIERPDQLDQRVLDRFTTSLLDKRADVPLSKTSVASHSRSVRVFLGYARAQGEMVAGKSKVPTPPKKIVVTLERAEIEAMENAAERDELIVRVLANTGLRLGKAAGAVPGGPDPERAGLVPEGQREGRQGTARAAAPAGRGPTPAQVRGPGQARRRRLRPHLPDDPAQRRTGLYQPLERRTVEQMIKGLAECAKIDPTRAYPHALRHSFATWALRSAINALMLQEVLGHADLTMISRNYSHVRAEDAADHLARLLEQ